MTTPISPHPLIIEPAADLLDRYPAIGRASQQLALAYAYGQVVHEDQLQAMGHILWQALDITAVFDTAQQQAGTAVLPLIITSDQPAIQGLPWETLHHPTHGFLGQSSAFSLSRHLPGRPLATQPVPQGPLKVLLFTSLPDDLDAEKARLNVEEEQAQVLEALAPLIKEGRVLLDMPDDGRFTTLQTRLREAHPHLVFLSGHGKFVNEPGQTEDPYAIFQFENEWGSSDFVREEEIAQAFAGTAVRCLVLSACELGQGSSVNLNQGLSWRLSRLGIPHVIGMRESVLDRAGTLLVRTLCEELARAEAVDVALQRGRQAITRPLADSPYLTAEASGLAEQSLGQWCLPMLISQQRGQPLLDWDFVPQPPATPEMTILLDSVSLPPRFVGRRSELRHIKSRLRQGQLHQLLITGPGGQGKTALAGKLAQDLRRQGYQVLAYSARPENRWQDFILELELLLSAANAQKYDRLLPRYTEAQAQANLLLRLLLPQFDYKVLLFFDNLESLQEPQTHELQSKAIQGWLAAAQGWLDKGLILLLTSRWALPGWPEGAVHRLRHATYGDFLQMAQPTLPQTLLQRRDWLRQVYDVLHGNGRGLHFFAKAVQNLTGEEEADFLARLAAAEAELQTDMAIAHIVAHLPPAAQALLPRLPAYQTPVPEEGVFCLGLDLAAPELGLTQLLAVSLVEQTAAPAWQTVAYQLSPLVAAWLASKQVAVEVAWLQAAATYQDYLFRSERRTLPQAIVLHQAWQRAGETARAHRLALDVIVGRLNRQGLYQTLLERWLPPICQAQDLATRAEALGQTGKQHLHLGNFQQALPYFEQSLHIRQEIGDKSGEGTTLNNMATTAHARGDYDTALKFLQQSLHIRQEIGDKSGEGTTLNNMATTAHARGDYDTALKFLQQSLHIRQEIGDKSGEGTTLNNISQIYDARGDYDTALKFLQQSLHISQEIGDKSGEGTTLNNISQIYDARGDYDTALKFLQQSLHISQEIGDKSGEGTTLNNMATTAHARGDYDTALKFLQQSLHISQEIGDKSGEGTTLNNMATTAHARGDYDTALKFLSNPSTSVRKSATNPGKAPPSIIFPKSMMRGATTTPPSNSCSNPSTSGRKSATNQGKAPPSIIWPQLLMRGATTTPPSNSCSNPSTSGRKSATNPGKAPPSIIWPQLLMRGATTTPPSNSCSNPSTSVRKSATNPGKAPPSIIFPKSMMRGATTTPPSNSCSNPSTSVRKSATNQGKAPPSIIWPQLLMRGATTTPPSNSCSNPSTSVRKSATWPGYVPLCLIWGIFMPKKRRSMRPCQLGSPSTA